MNTALRFLLCGLAVAVSAAADTPAVRTGRVLVLENERALEGDIRGEEGNYCVRRTVGEMWLAGDKVLALCANWEEAFAFVRSQANLRDPDERLRLARWCQRYGLHAQALAEATAALQMRPSHAASRQLVTLLQRPAPPAEKAPAAPSTQATQMPVRTAPGIDLSVESLGMFTARVQPVLMNTCASCHAGAKTTAFKLVRAAGTSSASHRATQQNMAAVLTQIDPARPNSSPLLMRSVTDHGKTGQAPIKAQSPPYRILQDWIQLTLATNPFLREQGMASAAAVATATKAPGEASLGRSLPVESPPAAAPERRVSSETKTKLAPVISRPLSAPEVPSTPAQPNASPTTVGPVDDFDPALYNRQFHPARQSSSSGD